MVVFGKFYVSLSISNQIFMDIFVRFKGQYEVDFLRRFCDRDSCYSYLAHHKWKDGFVFHFCGSKDEYKCAKLNHRRCKKCQKLISPTM